MDVTRIRPDEDDRRAVPPVGIGPLGWLALFAIFGVAVLLVAYF